MCEIINIYEESRLESVTKKSLKWQGVEMRLSWLIRSRPEEMKNISNFKWWLSTRLRLVNWWWWRVAKNDSAKLKRKKNWAIWQNFPPSSLWKWLFWVLRKDSVSPTWKWFRFGMFGVNRIFNKAELRDDGKKLELASLLIFQPFQVTTQAQWVLSFFTGRHIMKVNRDH